jgi:imidazolonepropionase
MSGGLRGFRVRQLLTMSGPDRLPPFRGHSDTAREAAIVGLVEDAALLLDADEVRFVGPFDARPPVPVDWEPVDVVTPGWVDCHTHSLFAGSRAPDFARRNAGASYVEILEAGGGISSTVAATRAATDAELVASLVERIAAFAAQGVALLEVKTGYGLALSEELRHLRLIAEAAAACPSVEVVATCLAAHVVPAEFRERREAYVDMVIDELLPRVVSGRIAEQFDVFCDRGAFTVIETRRLLEAARSQGLALRVHAEELGWTGGTALAAELGARSADHLEHATEQDFSAMAAAGTAAVLLPLVTVHLDLADRPKARRMIAEGVRVALSTDYNPGSAHGLDLSLTASLGCSLLKLTPAEALRAVTRVPAEVLGRGSRYGRIEPGYCARLVAFGVEDWSGIPWHMGAAPGRRWL